MNADVVDLQPVLEHRPIDIAAAARRLLFRRVFDLLGAPRGALWWQTPHPDLGEDAPLLRVYPSYDWSLHDCVFDATPTAAIFRTVGLVASRATDEKEGDLTPAPQRSAMSVPVSAPVWACCHDVVDGSSSWWFAWMYAQGGLEQPWIRLYEEHFMRCPMCIYHIEIARLTRKLFPGGTHEAKGLRPAVETIPPSS